MDLWLSMAMQQEPIDWRFVDVYIYIYMLYMGVSENQVVYSKVLQSDLSNGEN